MGWRQVSVLREKDGRMLRLSCWYWSLLCFLPVKTPFGRPPIRERPTERRT